MYSLFIRLEITLNKLAVNHVIISKQKLGFRPNEYQGKINQNQLKSC
jgi:hypothetical protein